MSAPAKSMVHGRGEFRFASHVAVGDSSPIKTYGWSDINVQVWGVTTAVVEVRGRLNESAPWEVLATFTNSNGRTRIDGSFVELQVAITSWTAGTIYAVVAGIDLVNLLAGH